MSYLVPGFIVTFTQAMPPARYAATPEPCVTPPATSALAVWCSQDSESVSTPISEVGGAQSAVHCGLREMEPAKGPV
eukprot:COSAG04_NODE_20_length_39202_cov_9.993530_3_plen_77_part_00